MAISTCIFDAYGTLFDVTAAARQAAEEPGRQDFSDKWQKVALDWRTKQLQYTWLRALTNAHTDFWRVTQDGLDWALDAAGLERDPELRERLLALYWELAAYPEVPEMLADLKKLGFQTGILSNGSPDMLAGAVESAQVSQHLDAVLSVQDVGIFKPHQSVYQMVCDRFDCKPANVLFVSSNGWDAAAASGFGFNCFWANRAGEPVDRLPWKPAHTGRDLTQVVQLAQSI